MATYLVDKKEIKENGQIYVLEEYSNGATVKYTKPTEKIDPEKPQLTDVEQTILETAINIEYLACLADLGL